MMTALAIAVLLTAPVAEVEPARNDELHDYLIEAADRHPQLRAQYEAWMAALERVPQVKSLEDPTLTYTQFVQSEINRFRAQLTQKFPWFGTRKTRGGKQGRNRSRARIRFWSDTLCSTRNLDTPRWTWSSNAKRISKRVSMRVS